ncbi:hypothetical protein BTR23_08730 [Alkalihalophilus pseudofirmus]|nr:hypothetical protein BTR23_08730 [Alkalihalophilus pseudofirmus]
MYVKKIRHIYNLFSGVVVLLFSLWMSGPGIAETDSETYRWYFMLFFVLWLVGFIMQFNMRARNIGIILTFIPVVFIFTLLIKAVFM